MLKLFSRGLLLLTSLITINLAYRLLLSLTHSVKSLSSSVGLGVEQIAVKQPGYAKMTPEHLSSDSLQDRVDVLTATAHELQGLLANGSITSVDLVHLYVRQIEKHKHQGLKLNAVISVAPIDLLIEKAKELDQERASGNVRSPLHGIPILVKDNIMTESSLGMDTTCGSFAFKGVKVKKNAPIVDRLIKSGLIIIGKANLSVSIPKLRRF